MEPHGGEGVSAGAVATDGTVDQPGKNNNTIGRVGVRRTFGGGDWNDTFAMPPSLEGGNASRSERIRRLEQGLILWGSTYVPAIEAGRRRDLIDRWSPPGNVQV